jgi:cathepsin L
MKSVICRLLLVFVSAVPFLGLHGQGPKESSATRSATQMKLAQVYAQREQTAPAEVKAKISSLRAQVVERKLTFNIGYTEALDKSLENLAGTRAPANLPSLAAKQNQIASQMLSVDSAARAEYEKAHPGVLPEWKYRFPAPCASRPSYDWRKVGKVTGVRNQGGCGSCWAFGAMGAFEGSYLIRNNISLDTSEQHVLNCSGAGSCGGGWHAGVFDWMIKNGNGSEADDSYTANDHACKTGVSTPYRAVAWGYVKSDGGIPTVAEMKTALCEHGPLTVAVYATPLFQGYAGGVFNEMDTSHGINHDITLIGWDDSKHAWLIKNSWGTNWGETGGYGTERGYMWIDYNSNNIGYGAAWVQAQNRLYILPHRYYELVPEIKPLPDPMKNLPINKSVQPHM